jgi:hypothetical protein
MQEVAGVQQCNCNESMFKCYPNMCTQQSKGGEAASTMSYGGRGLQEGHAECIESNECSTGRMQATLSLSFGIRRAGALIQKPRV